MMKVNKTRARKEFNKGNAVWLLPCKAVLGSMWIVPSMINKNFDSDFDTLVNHYEAMNCSNPTGKYVHFYIDENAE